MNYFTAIFIALYILSASTVWWYTSKMYSKDGGFENLEPDSTDVLITFMPLINTIMMLVCFLRLINLHN